MYARLMISITVRTFEKKMRFYIVFTNNNIIDIVLMSTVIPMYACIFFVSY